MFLVLTFIRRTAPGQNNRSVEFTIILSGLMSLAIKTGGKAFLRMGYLAILQDILYYLFIFTFISLFTASRTTDIFFLSFGTLKGFNDNLLLRNYM